MKIETRIITAFCFFFWLSQAQAADTILADGPIKSLDLSAWKEGKISHTKDQDGNPCLWSYQGFSAAPDRCRLRITLREINPDKLGKIFSAAPHTLTSDEKKVLDKQGGRELDYTLGRGAPELRNFGRGKMLYNQYGETMKAMIETADGSRRCVNATEYVTNAFFLSGNKLEEITISNCFDSSQAANQKLDQLIQSIRW